MSGVKVICANAVTPTGYIARDDGQEDFLPHEGWTEFLGAAKRYNNFIVGRERLKSSADYMMVLGSMTSRLLIKLLRHRVMTLWRMAILSQTAPKQH